MAAEQSKKIQQQLNESNSRLREEEREKNYWKSKHMQSRDEIQKL